MPSNKKRFKPMKFVSFIELSDDTDELLEFLSQAESLNTQAETELKLRRAERDLIKKKLKKIRGDQKHLRISDHAIVRYLERVCKIDIEACKQEILSKLPNDLYTSVEPVFVTLSDDHSLQYVIRDNLIISVTPNQNATDNTRED